MVLAPQTPQASILAEAHIEEVDGRYKVIWAGWWWGGTFCHMSDAVLCRDWCDEQPDEDREAWVIQNETPRCEACGGDVVPGTAHCWQHLDRDDIGQLDGGPRDDGDWRYDRMRDARDEAGR